MGGGEAHGAHGAAGHGLKTRPKGWPEHWPADYEGWNKDIWTPFGGPWCNPRHWRRNTAYVMLGIFVICIPIFRYSAKHEQRPVPPAFWIPSQMWCKNFGPPLEAEGEEHKFYYPNPNRK